MRISTQRSSFFRALLIGGSCLVLALTCFMVDRVEAQTAGAGSSRGAAAPADKSYRTLPVDNQIWRKGRNKFRKILLSGQFRDENDKAAFDNMYKRFLLARWSLPENREALVEFRKQLHIECQRCGTGDRPPEVHKHLNKLILGCMGVFAEGPYHPAVRVNAILTIGELNAVESSSPRPLPAGLAYLLKTVSSPKQIDAIKAAALTGIMRHAELGAIDTPEKINAVQASMLKVLEPNASAGSEDGRQWMQAQAAKVLGKLGAGASNQVVVKSLVSVLSNDKLRLATRCAAAEALGKINLRAAGTHDYPAIAQSLGQLAVDVYAKENTTASLRRLRARLRAVQEGLAAIAKVSRQGTIPQINSLVTTMLDKAEKHSSDGSTVLRDARADVEKLQGLVKQPAA